MSTAKFCMNCLFVVMAIVVILGIAHLGWTIERKLNYTFSYQGQVKEEIVNLVKPECLKK